MSSRWSRTALTAAGAAIVAVAGLAPPAAAAPATVLVSANRSGGVGNRSSAEPAISGNGRFVAFTSHSTNLVAGDTNSRQDVFLRDLMTGTTRRVSLGPQGRQGNRRSHQAAVSTDGRYVVFSSDATNLVAGDTNGWPDVFVRDTVAGVTRRISVGPGGVQANRDSAAGAISGDGRYVAFVSGATNLVPGDTNGVSDLFVRDTVANTTSRLSLGPGGVQSNGFADGPSISADGRFVAFNSAATNLVAGDTNGVVDVFLRDRVAGTTRRISVGPGGVQANGATSQSAISADGRHVAYTSEASNLTPADTDALPDVLIRDLAAGTNARVSPRTDNLPGSFSSEPDVSGTGRFVAFVTSSALVPGDSGSSVDVYARDMATGAFRLVSVAAGGGSANGPSADPSIADSGTPVAFTSAATDIVPGDTNGFDDVFAR
jgi:TolB protein